MPYFNQAGSAPVLSVNTKKGIVVLDATDVGAVAATNGIATGTRLDLTQHRQAPTQDGVTGAVTLDYALGDWFKVRASGNVQIVLANVPVGVVSAMVLEAIDFGSVSVTWPGGSRFRKGVLDPLSTSGRDYLLLITDGAGGVTVGFCGDDYK